MGASEGRISQSDNEGKIGGIKSFSIVSDILDIVVPEPCVHVVLTHVLPQQPVHHAPPLCLGDDQDPAIQRGPSMICVDKDTIIADIIVARAG